MCLNTAAVSPECKARIVHKQNNSVESPKGRLGREASEECSSEAEGGKRDSWNVSSQLGVKVNDEIHTSALLPPKLDLLIAKRTSSNCDSSKSNCPAQKTHEAIVVVSNRVST